MNTFEMCKTVRGIVLRLSSEVISYNWSDQFIAKEMKSIPDKIMKASWFEWVDIYKLTPAEMDELGFGTWSDDDPLRLIPLWLFPFIVDGVDYTSINGDVKSRKEEMDNDHRFGCVAWGIINKGE